MNEIWGRLTPQARDRVDTVLRDRGLVLAIMVLRKECGLDPMPDLYEAQETVTQRQSWLLDKGMLDAAPPKALDASEVAAAATAIGCPVVAVEAVWDGDTQGWMLRPDGRAATLNAVILASVCRADNFGGARRKPGRLHGCRQVC